MKTIYNIRPKGMNVGNDAIAIAMQNFKACGELVNLVTPATSKYDGGGLYGLTNVVYTKSISLQMVLLLAEAIYMKMVK